MREDAGKKADHAAAQLLASTLLLLATGPALAGGPTRRSLFVFGDSYADTGNLPKTLSPSWSQPYGRTFPKRPAGRFSDGRVFTDYLASFMGIPSPAPYEFRRYGRKLLPFGMNFAAGGSGVFDDTSLLNDSLTVQIHEFRAQLSRGGPPPFRLRSSVALVAVSGNDYEYYRDDGGTMDGLKTFTPKLIRRLERDLQSLGDLGVPQVAVTNLHPIGCLPLFTRTSSYETCNRTVNLAVAYHNQLLRNAVHKLNRRGTATFLVVDLFRGFTSVLQQGSLSANGTGGRGGAGNDGATNILKPCCEAQGGGGHCGSVDLNGMPTYAVCTRPDSAFYWDALHPTQAGWNAVFSSLKDSLTILLR